MLLLCDYKDRNHAIRYADSLELQKNSQTAPSYCLSVTIRQINQDVQYYDSAHRITMLNITTAKAESELRAAKMMVIKPNAKVSLDCRTSVSSTSVWLTGISSRESLIIF